MINVNFSLTLHSICFCPVGEIYNREPMQQLIFFLSLQILKFNDEQWSGLNCNCQRKNSEYLNTVGFISIYS